MSISGKKILFFSVKFFNLELDIIESIESFGGTVKYFDERPSNSKIIKGILRVKPKLIHSRTTRYYLKILEEIYTDIFDYVLVLRGEVIPKWFLKELKFRSPKCKFVIYNWDSISNNPNFLLIKDIFDRKYSFDPKDCIKYNLTLRPLFYCNDYKTIEDSKREIDVCFIGTAHSDRYEVASKVKQKLEQNNLKPFFFFYMQGKLVYLYKRLFDKSFKDFEYADLSFFPLNRSETVKIISKSKCILDINHPNQTGLTIRTIEAIGAKKKLATTNSTIQDYPFYSKENILIINRKNPEIPKSFIDSEYKEIDLTAYQNLSIRGWIKEILS
jgi:hypothetical protein